MNSTIKPSPCKTCGSLYHSAMYHKPRKPIETHTVPKQRRPIKRANGVIKRTTTLKQQGKQYDIWKETKARWWLRFGPTGHTCHYCGVGLDVGTLTLDHRIPRSRAPKLRYKVSNLVPCCFTCNGLKGSVDHDSYQHNCPDTKKEA